MSHLLAIADFIRVHILQGGGCDSQKQSKLFEVLQPVQGEAGSGTRRVRPSHFENQAVLEIVRLRQLSLSSVPFKFLSKTLNHPPLVFTLHKSGC